MRDQFLCGQKNCRLLLSRHEVEAGYVRFDTITSGAVGMTDPVVEGAGGGGAVGGGGGGAADAHISAATTRPVVLPEIFVGPRTGMSGCSTLRVLLQ